MLLVCFAPVSNSVLPFPNHGGQAATGENYNAICGLYFLSSIGLGGNIPIDATIALESLPQNRRALVALLSMWQPIGVVIASAIAYGTAAKYRCDVTLPACSAVGDGQACCTSGSNMGWRYEVIIIGAMTLAVFFARYFIFTFHESPKWLLSRGREQEAIDVLHKIAKFNGSPEPTLTVEDFRKVDDEMGSATYGTAATGSSAKAIVLGVFKNLAYLRGLFADKLAAFTFFLLALAYMVIMFFRAIVLVLN
jgi:MFS family permease